MKKVLTCWAETAPLLEQDYFRQVYESVPKWRREKADRIRFMEDRALSIGAWRLYMLAAERYDIGEELPYNLSHSGDCVLVSIAPAGEKVGCDVETVKALREPLAKRFFGREEYAWLMDRPKEERTEAFYRLWVLKESFLKATRRGMSLGLDTFAFEMPEASEPTLLRQPESLKDRYYFREYSVPAKNARMAVCSTCQVFCEPQKMELI